MNPTLHAIQCSSHRQDPHSIISRPCYKEGQSRSGIQRNNSHRCGLSQLLRLITVCPLSVLSNWEKQIHDHVAGSSLNSYTYHGDSRQVTAATLKQYDVRLALAKKLISDRPDYVSDRDFGCCRRSLHKRSLQRQESKKDCWPALPGPVEKGSGR